MNINADLYKILGVPSDASDEDIKKAHRKLAKEHHPDKGSDSHDKMAEINAAYDILGDPDKRKQYDRMKAGGGGSNYNPFANGQGFPPGFNPFADMDMMFNRKNRKQNYVKNLEVSIALDVYAVAKGREIPLEFPIDECCAECDGKGTDKNSKTATCRKCAGSGEFKVVNGPLMFSVTCPDCNGNGQIGKMCQSCNGSGVIPKNKKIEVKVPKGIRHGSTLCMREQGHFSPGTKTRGDINIRVGINEHRFFKLSSEDVHVQIPVKFKDMIVGTEIKVPTLYGEALLKIPEGSQNGSVLRLLGKGVQSSPNNPKLGDMLVHIVTDMPKGFSGSFKEKIREIDDSGAEYEMSKSYSDVLKEIERENG